MLIGSVEDVGKRWDGMYCEECGKADGLRGVDKLRDTVRSTNFRVKVRARDRALLLQAKLTTSQALDEVGRGVNRGQSAHVSAEACQELVLPTNAEGMDRIHSYDSKMPCFPI